MTISIRRDKYTALPTLLAIQAKGYKLTLIYTKKDSDLEGLDIITRINNLVVYDLEGNLIEGKIIED